MTIKNPLNGSLSRRATPGYPRLPQGRNAEVLLKVFASKVMFGQEEWKVLSNEYDIPQLILEAIFLNTWPRNLVKHNWIIFSAYLKKRSCQMELPGLIFC